MNQSSLGGRDYAAAVCVVLIWGTNFLAMKFALQELTPFQLGAGRYLFAVLPLLLFVKPPRLAWKWVVLYGLFQGVGQFGLLFVSLHIGLSAALASVVLQTQVFFTALLGFLLLGEHVSRALRVGLLFAALGLGCFGINFAVAGGTGGTTPAGLLLCVAAAAMWAGSNIVVRRAQHSTPAFEVLPFMVWSSLVPIIPFVLLSLAFDPAPTRWQWTGASWRAWLSLAYLGWFATILAYAIWTGLLKRHAVSRVAPFSLAVPLVGVTAGMLVLGDTISAWQWAGIGLVVVSLAIVMFGARLVKRLR